MKFSQWLNNELKKREMSKSELVRQTRKSGYKVSHTQITYVLDGSRQAGPDTCIAIAHGLNLPREEVFRARGWLLRKPQEVVPPNATPSAAKLIRTLTNLDNQSQVMVAEAFQNLLDTVFNFSQLPVTNKKIHMT